MNRAMSVLAATATSALSGLALGAAALSRSVSFGDEGRAETSGSQSQSATAGASSTADGSRSASGTPDASASTDASSSPDASPSLDLAVAVRSLPRAHAEVVILRFVHGLSLAETAVALGSSIDSVKGRQARAFAELRRKLELELAMPVAAMARDRR